MRPLQLQIQDSVSTYVRAIQNPKPSVSQRAQIAAAMLSGMWLTARFMSSNDGSSITPQQIEQAVKEEGERRGLSTTTLKDFAP